jgi:hypothetical protein
MRLVMYIGLILKYCTPNVARSNHKNSKQLRFRLSLGGKYEGKNRARSMIKLNKLVI